MQKLTDSEIASRIDEEIRNSVGYHGGELADQRKTAMEYYYGEKFGNEIEGRSSYVSRDVSDTIEWIMPSLMKIFMGGDTVVRFEPQGPEDDQKAAQATDYVNYIFNRQNDGFLTLYTWFKDALLAKNGFVKVYAEEYTDYKTDTYEGLTDDQFAFLTQDETVEVVEHTTYQTPTGIFHDAKLRTKKAGKKICVIPIPPEEVLVNRHATAPLKKNRFVCHRRQITISELKAMGYENVDTLASDDSDNFNEERLTRFAVDESSSTDTVVDPANRLVWIEEALVNMDVDGDGIAERRKITKVGNRILDNEEDDCTAIVTVTPIIIPHKLIGMSVADLVMDLQLLKSTVFRQILDNMYLANNGRYMALEGMVNIDDLLTSRPGGIVRVKTFDAVKPMQPPLLGAPAFSLLEYIDTIRESRTGVSRSSQGLNADTLSKTGSNGIADLLSAAQQRTELIARVFAETGVKDLFYAILECVQKHQDQPQVVRLRNEWVEMDPREWTNKFDMTVMVGLGTGSRETLSAAMLKTIEMQFACLQGGLPIVQPQNIYNAFQEFLKSAGIKGGDMFFTSPEQIPPQQPQPDPKMMEVQARAQAEQQKLQIAATKMQSGLQQKQQKMEQDFALKTAQFQQEGERIRMEAMQEAERMRVGAMIDKMKTDAMIELEREKAAIQAQMKAMEMAHSSGEANKDRALQQEQSEQDRLERIIQSFADNMAKVSEAVSRPKKRKSDDD